jgi:hypothetical protein
MRRGFKTWAEKQAVIRREELGLRPEAPLPARTLAEHSEVLIAAPEDIPGMTELLLHQLLRTDPQSWSAATVATNGCILIIHNTSHTPNRQESDLMHEMAHLLCCHIGQEQYERGTWSLWDVPEEPEWVPARIFD